MGVHACRVVILVVCIGLLSIQPDQVYGLGSIDLALRFLRNSRVLKGMAVEQLDTKMSIAPSPSTIFDPNQSNKRRVRRGSDPIHNRYTRKFGRMQSENVHGQKDVSLIDGGRN